MTSFNLGLAYKNAGYTCTADWLAKEGYDTYDWEVLKLFKREIVKSKRDVLIDGLFSSSCYNYLKAMELNGRCKLTNIFISTPEDERISRMYKRQKFTTIEQAQKHTKASDFIKGTCGLYQISDEADYTIDGRNSSSIINKYVKRILQKIRSQYMYENEL